MDELWTSWTALPGQSSTVADYADRTEADRGRNSIEDFQADAQGPTTPARRQLGADVMREVERRVLLTVLDRKWREHLYEMDYLREGIGLRAMASATRWWSTSARATTCSAP